MKNVRKALYLAQRDVGSIGKDDEAEVRKEGKLLYKYAYTSSEDMLAHCREALHKHGLSWEMTSNDVHDKLPGFSCPTLVGVFELCHGESGELLERTYKMPIASRNDADKALAGAITYLLGQATRMLLLVPKVSDDDAANNPDRRTDQHGGWERGGGQRRDPPPQRDADELEVKDSPGLENTQANRERAAKLIARLKKHTPDVTLEAMRKDARVAETGILSPEQLVKLLRWAEERLRSFEPHGDDPTDSQAP